MKDSRLYDVLIIGAGPTGLACAVELHRRGFDYLVIEKGCIVNSLFGFPTQMIYFTTPELLEIGDLPLICEREKPSRIEAGSAKRTGSCVARVARWKRISSGKPMARSSGCGNS